MPKDDSLNYSNGSIRVKIRSSLTQFSGLFSEFNKYISPAYHHDRCDRSVHMRLYRMHKRDFVMVIACTMALGLLAVFIGLAGPPITLVVESAGNSSKLPQGPFIVKTQRMSAYSQQLWVVGKFYTGNIEDEIFEKSFQISTTLEGINEEHKPVPIIRPHSHRNRTRHIQCRQSECSEFHILHLGFLYYSHYLLTVELYGLEAFHQRYHINRFLIYFKTYNSAFTQMEIWFRSVFILTSFIATCWFLHSLRKYLPQDWSLEQRWMSFLLPLLLLYNNPIFPLTFLTNSPLPSIIDNFFQTLFFAGLLLFWLSAYHGLRQNERPFLTFYLPKLAVVVPLWLSTVIVATNQKLKEFDDPTFSYDLHSEHFYNLKIFSIVSGTICVLYIIYLVLRAYSDLRSMPYFDVRLRFLTLTLFSVTTLIILLTLLKFGIDALEDNFVANLATTYKNSAQFMALYGLINFIVYAMAYVYSPVPGTVLETQLTKDNPTFSMINDSDEEVIYGSDEDSRKPLNRSCNNDDSD